MGLRVWREPVASAEPKCTLKTDPTAHARSSIRRRPSVHRGSRRARLTVRSPPPPDPSLYAIPAVPQINIRDSVSGQRDSSSVNASDANQQRMIEYLRLRREERLRASGAETRLAQQNAINDQMLDDMLLDGARRYTEHVPRQRHQHAQNTTSAQTILNDLPRSRPMSRRGVSNTPPEVIHPLRRMTGRSVTDADPPTLRHSATIGGLGDRHRSPSAGFDPWETHITTITPEDSGASTEASSFGSNAEARLSHVDIHRPRSINVSRHTPPHSQGRSREETPVWARPSSRIHNSISQDEVALARHAADPDRQRPLFGSFDHGEIVSANDIWPDVGHNPVCDTSDEEAQDSSDEEADNLDYWDQHNVQTEIGELYLPPDGAPPEMTRIRQILLRLARERSDLHRFVRERQRVSLDVQDHNDDSTLQAASVGRRMSCLIEQMLASTERTSRLVEISLQNPNPMQGQHTEILDLAVQNQREWVLLAQDFDGLIRQRRASRRQESDS